MIVKKISFIILLFFSFQLFAVLAIDSTNTSETGDSAQVDNSAFLDSLSYNLFYKGNDQPLKQLDTPSFSGMLFRMILSLVLISIILYIALKVVKRLNNNNLAFNNKNMKIIDSMNIAFKHSIYIVSIMDKIYLFSLSNNNLQLIEKVVDPEQLEKLKLTYQDKPESFKNIFDKFKFKKK